MREIIKKRCSKCGKEYDAYNAKQKYCSAECKKADGHRIYRRTCPVCGKIFYATGGGRSYCSDECKNNAIQIRIKPKVQDDGKRMKYREEHLCLYCGCLLQPPRRKFCSDTCQNRYKYRGLEKKKGITIGQIQMAATQAGITYGEMSRRMSAGDISEEELMELCRERAEEIKNMGRTG